MSHDLQPEPDELARAVATAQELADYIKAETTLLDDLTCK